MRKIMMTVGTLALLLAFAACGEQGDTETDAPREAEQEQQAGSENEGDTEVAAGETYVLKVEGMT